MTSGPESVSVVYVVGTYPLLTTTFIDREIRSLQRLGVDVHIVAARRPPADMPLSADQRDLQRGVTYLLPAAPVKLLVSHLSFGLRRPYRYMSTCLYLLTRPHPDIRARFKTLLHFGQGVYAAHLVRRRTFQELHAHFADRAATIAIVASRLLDKTYSLSIHAGADIFVRPVLLREKIIEARHVATCTEHNRTHIESIVGATVARKITPIRHGLDVQLYGAGAGTAASIPVILSVGQLTDRKGFAHLVAACGSLRDRGYRFECRIVGRGPQREQLGEMITRAQLHDVVTLCGALSHEAVVEEYRRATMFVLPCIRTTDGDVDGVPNVIAEAMASQLPVVSTDLPAIREFVTDGTSGVLVRSGDVESLVDAIAGLLDDPARRAELGSNGRAAVLREFDADANVRHFAETLWPDQFAPTRALQEDGRR